MQDQTYNPASQWEYEKFVANPSTVQVVVLVVITVAIFVALSWFADAFFPPGLAWWIHPVIALFMVVTLIQGLPTMLQDDMASTLPFSSRLRFYIPLWASRTVLLVVLFEIYFSFVELGTATKWLYLGVMGLVIVPVMWFPLLQIRQLGLLSLMGRLPASFLPVGTLIPISQVGLWGTTAVVWFGDYSLWLAVIVTLVAAAWHGIGNVVLLMLLTRAHKQLTAQGTTPLI